jgi:putative transposase
VCTTAPKTVISPLANASGACAASALPERTQAFLSSFGPIRQHFALKRHLLRASLYRKQFTARFESWRLFTGITQNPSAAF